MPKPIIIRLKKDVQDKRNSEDNSFETVVNTKYEDVVFEEKVK